VPTPDAIRYTALSESAPRTRKVDTLQIHHATTTSLSGLEALMAPGGRTVSANEAMGSDGYRVGKVPPNRRAFTSATVFDHQSYTVEVCNTSLAPSWGVSDAAHEALARLAVELWREGMLGSLTRRHIIGHNEVPGAYATACPGPSMNLARVVSRAQQLQAAGYAGLETRPLEDDMFDDQDRKNVQLIADTLTRGIANVKHNGEVWDMLNRLANTSLISARVWDVADTNPTDVDPNRMGNQLVAIRQAVQKIAADGPAAGSGMAALTDVDLANIAKAVVDEQSRRLSA
jgi:hypothetical protein